MTLKQELIQKTNLLFESGCIDGIGGFDTDDLQKIADEQGNGRLVHGDRWWQWGQGWNLHDSNYEPSEGDLLFFEGNDEYAYYIVAFEDVCEDPSEEL